MLKSLRKKPRAAQRKLLCMLGSQLGYLLVLLIAVIREFIIPMPYALGVFIGVFVSPFFGVLVWWWWSGMGLSAKLRRCNGAVCVQCEYDLSDLEDEGRCPECGLRFCRRDTVRAWRDCGLYLQRSS